jgi:hypothetical protein
VVASAAGPERMVVGKAERAGRQRSVAGIRIDARQHQRAGADALIVPENVLLMLSLPVVSVAKPSLTLPAPQAS